MPLPLRRLVLAGAGLLLLTAGCDNPIVRSWAPPATIRVADPTDSEYPVWSLDLPPGTRQVRYRFVSTEVSDGTKTTLVDSTDVDVSALPPVDDESGWDRSENRWVVFGDDGIVSFSYDEALAEAAARYTLEVAILTDGAPGEWSRRDTIVDLTAPAAPTIENSITLTSETAGVTFSGPDEPLSHYVVQWDAGTEERVAASGDPPIGVYDIPVTLVNGDSHSLWVRAVDTAGNRSDPATSAITVDLSFGLVTFPTSANAGQSTSPRPVWTWQAPTGSSKIRYALVDSSENELLPQTEATVNTADPTGIVQPADPLAEGAYTLVAQAWMPATASWSDENSYTITITVCDYDAPDVTGDSPVNTLRPTFWWPEIGNDQPYRYQINGQIDGNWIDVPAGSTTTRVEGATRYRELTLTQDLIEGTHTIYLQVQDNDGVWSAAGGFPFIIEQSRPRLTGLAVYNAADEQISGIDLDHIPPGSYIRVSFSETMDVGSDPTALVQVNPAIALDAPVDVSVAPDVRTDFTVTPTSDWTEGKQYSLSVQAGITDMASNELDISTSPSLSVDFAAALSIATATGSANMPDTDLAGILGGLAGGSVLYVHQISTLDLSGASYDGVRTGITDLTGLEQFGELRYLDLEGTTGLDSTDYTTVSALASLTKLGYLNIADTNITTVSFLSAMPQLQVLFAEKDEAVLGAGYVGITDISPLSAIAGLRVLDVSGNDLNAAGVDATTQVIDPLKAQTGLETLLLSDNSSFTDVSFLTSALPDLTVLWLNGCGLSAVNTTNQTALEEITFADNPSLVSVTGLPTTLTMVNLGGSGVDNLSAIAGLTNLTTLIVSGTTLTDISDLAGISTLTSLTLSSCGLVDSVLSGVVTAANLPNLTNVYLSGNGITDITATGANGMNDLATLDLADNSITALPISGFWSGGFSSLAYLDLSGNEIADVAPLAGLPSAGSILLARNNLGDVGNSTISDGIAELAALYSIADGPTYPPNPVAYLVFSGNTNMSTTMASEITALQNNVSRPAGAEVLGPDDANPFE